MGQIYEGDPNPRSGVEIFFEQHETYKMAIAKLIAAHKIEFTTILKKCMKKKG